MDKKYIFYINCKYDFYMQLFFANVIQVYLLKNNICKNKQILYRTSINNIKNNNSIILPIYGIYDYNKYDFDDKILFYKYLNNNINILYNIKLIPTYDSLKYKNNFAKYIIKHKYGKGSKNNIIIEDYLHNIIHKYDTNIYQIQKLIKFNNIYVVNVSCINGKIISFICAITKSLTKKDYKGNITQILCNYIKYKNIKQFIYNIINNISYTGFIEFEFLVTNKNIYIMECNPRTSGLILSDLYCNEIINKYIQHFFNKHNQHLESKYNKSITINFNKFYNIKNVYSNLLKLIIMSSIKK